MCGIIGYVGSENAVPIIMEGLKKLEYRGYDSAGIAVCGNGVLDVIKQKGRLTALEAKLSETAISANMGIGHTRWATHGEPSDINSHPHTGSGSKIAVVHNGIIENYNGLKERLKTKGVKFASETDSEVIAQLAEYYYNRRTRETPQLEAPKEAQKSARKEYDEIMETVVKVINRLEGSYALGIMCLDYPDTLIAVKKDNPLIIGVSEQGNFIASDVPAVLKHTDKVFYLEDKEIAVLEKSSVKFYNMDGEELRKTPETISWSVDSAEKGGEPHFMLKEIKEQPKILRDTIQNTINGKNKEIIDSINIADYNKIVITACGSAYNAGVVARYVFERLCRFPSIETELASEFRYKDAVIDEKTLVILISQSGETADTIAAMREAKSKGAATLSIVNVIGSTIAKESDFCLFTSAGPEIAVATTKAFSAQLAVLYLIGVEFAFSLKKISEKYKTELLEEIKSIPDKVARISEENTEIGVAVQHFAAECVAYKSIFFIGRNIDYAIALEGSLKLKEISYIHSEAYAGGELKHGTISLIEDNTLVVALSNCDKLFPKIMSNAEQVISRGAKVLLVGSEILAKPSDKLSVISTPSINELFSPSLSVIVLQLFSYYVAANKGLDIDKPRNLAKSVTVE